MAPDRDTVRAVIDAARADGRAALTAPEGKRICDAYGIATPAEDLATSAEDAVTRAVEMGLPVVLKIVSPDILHKTEAGGVLVGLDTPHAVKVAYEQIVASARDYAPNANIIGVQVQQM